MLSGESGTGKTTILLQAALNAAKASYGVAIFEKEMSEEGMHEKEMPEEVMMEAVKAAYRAGLRKGRSVRR